MHTTLSTVHTTLGRQQLTTEKLRRKKPCPLQGDLVANMLNELPLCPAGEKREEKKITIRSAFHIRARHPVVLTETVSGRSAFSASRLASEKGLISLKRARRYVVFGGSVRCWQHPPTSSEKSKIRLARDSGVFARSVSDVQWRADWSDKLT